MTETVIFPEMLQAGVEALTECRSRELEDVDTAIAVYLAMAAVYSMAILKERHQTVH